MRKLLSELRFSIGDEFPMLAGLMNATHRARVENKSAPSIQVSRSSALAAILQLSPEIREALAPFGLDYERYLSAIGLRGFVDNETARDVDAYFSLEETLTRYAQTRDAVLVASVNVFAIAILEDAVGKMRAGFYRYELESQLRDVGLDAPKLSRALESRSLPFDVRRKTPPPPPLAKEAHAPFYSDHPARQDALNRKAVAETIATMIDSVWKEDAKQEAAKQKSVKSKKEAVTTDDGERAFVVHLHGRWGSGKSSILNFLSEALLAQRPNLQPNTPNCGGNQPAPWVIVKYNAWRNQHLGPAWWTLTEAVYHQARQQMGGWFNPDRRRLMLRDRWWRIRSSYAPYTVLAIVAIVAVFVVIGLWRQTLFEAKTDWFVEAWKILGTIATLIAGVFAFGHTYSVGSARTAKSYLELSRDPLSPLTRRYNNLIADIRRPVAVFVDDLDRCNAEFVVEILQTIQTLFRQARVLYVVAADRDWLCASYRQQYSQFSDSLGEPGKSLGHLFIEKVFQLSVEVPRLNEHDRNRYWMGLIQPAERLSDESTSEIADRIASELESANSESAIIEIVDRYRENANYSAIAASKGFQRMHAASLVREREHFLIGYAHLIEANPRAMKRLLNAYGFRRGFDIQSPVRCDPDALVRWTILENRWPILADYLENRSGGRGETDIIKALMEDPEVRKVAEGLTWDKLRPVPSAPDQQPATEITPGAGAKKSQERQQLLP